MKIPDRDYFQSELEVIRLGIEANLMQTRVVEENKIKC